MDQNDKKNTPNRPGGGKNSNVRSIISLVSWALLLTILISYASTYMSSAGNQSSSITVEYSEFKDMVAEGQVAQVEFDTSENILHITPADGLLLLSKGLDDDATLYYAASPPMKRVPFTPIPIRPDGNRLSAWTCSPYSWNPMTQSLPIWTPTM